MPQGCLFAAKLAVDQDGCLATRSGISPRCLRHGAAILAATSLTLLNNRTTVLHVRQQEKGFGRAAVEGKRYSKKVLNLWARDGGICHICKGLVPVDVSPCHPKSPSQDHLRPRCKGGTLHLKALAHSWCNARRGHLKLGSKAFQEIDFAGGLEEASNRFWVDNELDSC